MTDETSYTDTDATEIALSNRYIAIKNPFRYRSYYFDIETGLYYLNSRYYDPETGRFINIDDINVIDTTKDFTNGINLYAYCLNNPVNDCDTDGNLSWWEKLLIGFAVIVVGGLLTAFTAGAGTSFLATFGSALLTSLMQASITAGINAGIGMVSGAIATGTFQGALNGLLDGLVDGFMWGGFLSGGAQIIGVIIPKTSGLKIGNHEFMYGTNKSKTLISINNKSGSSRFRIDIGRGSKHTQLFTGIHFHFGNSSKLRQLHRFFSPAILNGIIVSIADNLLDL